MCPTLQENSESTVAGDPNKDALKQVAASTAKSQTVCLDPQAMILDEIIGKKLRCKSCISEWSKKVLWNIMSMAC